MAHKKLTCTCYKKQKNEYVKRPPCPIKENPGMNGKQAVKTIFGVK